VTPIEGAKLYSAGLIKGGQMRLKPLFGWSCVAVLSLVSSACSSPSPSAPSQTAPFTIAAANTTAPSAYAGSCPVTLTFVGTIAGQVTQTGVHQYTYQLELSDGTKWGPNTDRIAINVAQPMSFTISNRRYDVTVTGSIAGSVRLRVRDPNDVLSPPVPLSVVCR